MIEIRRPRRPYVAFNHRWTSSPHRAGFPFCRNHNQYLTGRDTFQECFRKIAISVSGQPVSRQQLCSLRYSQKIYREASFVPTFPATVRIIPRPEVTDVNNERTRTRETCFPYNKTYLMNSNAPHVDPSVLKTSSVRKRALCEQRCCCICSSRRFSRTHVWDISSSRGLSREHLHGCHFRAAIMASFILILASVHSVGNLR